MAHYARIQITGEHMQLNLYPYNFYILYGALVLLLVFLIILAVKGVHLLKAISKETPTLQNMQKNVQLTQIKIEAMQEKKAEDDKKNRWLKPLIPFLLAAYHIYRQDNELHGLKGMGGAARQVLLERAQKNGLINQLKQMFGF